MRKARRILMIIGVPPQLQPQPKLDLSYCRRRDIKVAMDVSEDSVPIFT